MWELEKEVWIDSAHNLVGYQGPCANVHGHRWHITIFCKGDSLDEQGMLVDFVKIKKIVSELDHQHINEKVSFNPTAENLAKYLVEQIPFCYKVSVEETPGSRVTYVED